MILTKAENVKELYMIEMQGEVQYSGPFDGIRLGKLEEDGQRCKFMIGNHILKGKLEILAKPLCLLEKLNGNLVLTAMIKKKIIFSERPAPIPDHSKQIMKRLG